MKAAHAPNFIIFGFVLTIISIAAGAGALTSTQASPTIPKATKVASAMSGAESGSESRLLRDGFSDFILTNRGGESGARLELFDHFIGLQDQGILAFESYTTSDHFVVDMRLSYAAQFGRIAYLFSFAFDPILRSGRLLRCEDEYGPLDVQACDSVFGAIVLSVLSSEYISSP